MMTGMKEALFAKLPYAALIGINPKVRWGVIAGFPVIVLALVYFLLVSGVYAEIETNNEELKKVQKDVQTKETVALTLPELNKKIADMEEQMVALRKQLPEKKDIPDLLDEISAHGLKSGLEFVTFKPGQESEKDYYSEVPVDIVVNGSFHGLLVFFDKVSKMDRIVTFPNVSLSKGKRAVKEKDKEKEARTDREIAKIKGVPVTATCRAVTYRYLETKTETGQVKK